MAAEARKFILINIKSFYSISSSILQIAMKIAENNQLNDYCGDHIHSILWQYIVSEYNLREGIVKIKFRGWAASFLQATFRC